MHMKRHPLKVFNNYNNVELYKGVVVKTFKSRQRLYSEREFYDIFKDYFRVPKIKDVDVEKKTITYERIIGKAISDPNTLKRFDANALASIRSMIPKLFGIMRANILTEDLPQTVINGGLVHGDLRLDNIILSEHGNLYLIDFEAGNFLFREIDDAYLSLSISQVDEEKALKYEGITIRNDEEKEGLVLGKLFFAKALLMNPFISNERRAIWLENEYKFRNVLRLLRTR